MTTTEYKIGNVCIKINSSLDLSIMSLYKPFAIEPTLNSPDISIEIKQIDVKKIKKVYNTIICNLDCSLTYTWIMNGESHYMIFSKRLQKLVNSEISDIWILECDNDYSECILYIPSCTDDVDIINELSIRPWLQRLFIAHSSICNLALLHGALVDFEGRGIVFLGDSGSGKSTMCDIIKSTKATIIADDRFILDFSGELTCFGTPWNIKNPHYSINMHTTIAKVFILSHGNNQINYVGNSYRDMVYGIFPAILFPTFIPSVKVIERKLQYLSFIRNKCDVYSFAFKPDVSAIQYVIDPRERCFV